MAEASDVLTSIANELLMLTVYLPFYVNTFAFLNMLVSFVCLSQCVLIAVLMLNEYTECTISAADADADAS